MRTIRVTPSSSQSTRWNASEGELRWLNNDLSSRGRRSTVASYSTTGSCCIIVAFADGTEQRINFEPVLHGAMFEPLRDLEAFNAVKLDLEVGTLVWPTGADFDPATLHDWPLVREELAARARSWSPAAEDGTRQNETS